MGVGFRPGRAPGEAGVRRRGERRPVGAGARGFQAEGSSLKRPEWELSGGSRNSQESGGLGPGTRDHGRRQKMKSEGDNRQLPQPPHPLPASSLWRSG